MASIEAKREQFRKYLERCGLIESLSKALIRLYEEPNKPNDAIKFVRQLMCQECATEEDFENLKHNLLEANKKIDSLEQQLSRFKGNMEPNSVEVASVEPCSSGEVEKILSSNTDTVAVDGEDQANDVNELETPEQNESNLQDNCIDEIRSEEENVITRVRTMSEILNLLEDGWKKLLEDDECTASLLKKYFTREILDELSDKTTPNFCATLYDCVQCGLENHDALIGIYAADFDSYNTFNSLFEPIIVDCHDQQDNLDASLQKAPDWGNTGDIQGLDPEGKFIRATRIRIIRNLEDYPYFQKLTEEQFLEVETKIKTICESLQGEFKGQYQSIKQIDIETRPKMVERNILFSNDNRFLDSAGCYRFWPTGRGSFYTPSENFSIWVNSDNHLQFITMSKCGDLCEVYCRLVSAIKIFEENLTFAKHDRYGYVTSCPSDLGTTLRASVHIRLPCLASNPEKLKGLACDLNLEIHGIGGQNSEIVDGVMDVSNKHRLGYTEFELVKTLENGVKTLIQKEQDLNK